MSKVGDGPVRYKIGERMVPDYTSFLTLFPASSLQGVLAARPVVDFRTGVQLRPEVGVEQTDVANTSLPDAQF